MLSGLSFSGTLERITASYCYCAAMRHTFREYANVLQPLAFQWWLVGILTSEIFEKANGCYWTKAVRLRHVGSGEYHQLHFPTSHYVCMLENTK